MAENWRFKIILPVYSVLLISQLAVMSPPGQSAAAAIPALKNSASELATIGVKNLLELFEVVERLFRELFCPPQCIEV